MRFPAPLVPARLLRRYKRFLADVVLETGEEVTVHCANPGAMLGLTAHGNRVWLSRSANPGRKLPWSWELVEAEFGNGPVLVGINTGHPNAVAAEAVAAGALPGLTGYASLRREVKYGRNSRIDLLLEGDGRPPCYVEVKNVHLMRRPGLAEFPDCVTARGAKHLEELGDMAEAGHRAVMLFVVQMPADSVAVAADIDPAYAAAFARARSRGVEVLACACRITPEEIAADRLLPVAV
jgi:sugar fermentation stimulation protein A